MHPSGNKFWFFTIILLLFIGAYVLFLLITGTIHSGLHFIDDHEMVAIDMAFEKNITLLEEAFDRIEKDVNQLGRFRPLFHLHRALEVKLFGTDFEAMSIYLAAFNGVISFILFTFLLKSGFNALEAAAFAFIAMVGPQSETWWMLSTNEPVGMLFLGITLLLITVIGSRKVNPSLWVLLAVTTILTTLSKESFIVTVPALLFLVICLYAQSRKVNLIDATYAFLPLIIILYAVVLAELKVVKQDKLDYAGYDESTPVQNYLATLSSVLKRDYYIWVLLFQLMVLFVVSTYALFIAKQKKLSGNQPDQHFVRAGLFFLFGLLIIIPQVIVYTQSGFFGRYYLPLMVGQAMLLVAPLYVIRKITAHKLVLVCSYGACLAGVVFFLARNLNSVIPASVAFAHSGRAIQQVFAIVDKEADSNGNIVVVANSAAYEAVASVEVFLQHILRKPNPVYFFFTSPAEFTIKEQYKFENMKLPADIEVVLILKGMEYQFVQASQGWLNLKDFKYKQVEGFAIYYR